MKKKIVLAIAFICVAVCIGNYFYYATPHRFDIPSAAKLKIFNGTTGQSLEVTDTEVISRITENISAIEFERGKKEKIDGYAYTLTWYDADGKVMESLNLLGSGAIIKNDRRYTSNGKVNVEIDLEYIDTLFPPAE